MNWIDEALAAIAPRAALRRAQARIALEQVRSYDAAKLGRRTQGWSAKGGSANAALAPGFQRLRNRARDMVRNNEYAARVIDVQTANLIGTGITVIPQNKAEREIWNRWCKKDCDADGQLNFGGLQRLAVRTWKESGEVLVRRRWRNASDGLEVPMQLQVLEPDHLDDTKTGVLANGNVAILGVEFDLLGRRVAYWLFPQHPGELALLPKQIQSRRVPASEVLHLYRKDRPSQVRGVPSLAVALMRLRDLADYEQAELMRKKIEACFTAFIRTSDSNMSAGEIQKLREETRTTEKIAPGLIKYMRPDEEVTFGTPTAVAGYGEYSSTQLHALSVGAGVTYEQLTGDLSRVNYSSMRGGLIEFREMMAAEQWLTVMPMLIEPIRIWWREGALLAGKRLGKDEDKVTMPKRPYVDPLKDVLSDKEAIRAGIKTVSEVIREQGEDPDQVRDEIQAEREAFKAAGIVLDIDAEVSTLKINPADAAALSKET